MKEDKVPKRRPWKAAKLSRRKAMLLSGGIVAASAARALLRREAAVPVFSARHQRYDGDLERTIRDGLKAVGLDLTALRGLSVLLKPNLVEPSRYVEQRTTHSAIVVAAAHVFLQCGANVVVGEGAGHVRDTELLLAESGLAGSLEPNWFDFRDLNYDELVAVPNLGGMSRLKSFCLPRTVVDADLIVSMPKLKTHHWVGMTAAMKNLYGILPGIKYGWPKNVLHNLGIPETVFDINASIRNVIAIVDAITCMDGDGPILGEAKPMGLVIIGSNLPAVDSTCSRIAGFEPAEIQYLKVAANRLGPIDEALIIERGERWKEVSSPFRTVDLPHLRNLRQTNCTPK